MIYRHGLPSWGFRETLSSKSLIPQFYSNLAKQVNLYLPGIDDKEDIKELLNIYTNKPGDLLY